MLTEVHENGADSAGGSLYDVEKANFTFDGPVRQAKHVSRWLSFFDSTNYSWHSSQGGNVIVLDGLDARSPDGVLARRLKSRHVQMVNYTVHFMAHIKLLNARSLLVVLSELVSLLDLALLSTVVAPSLCFLAMLSWVPWHTPWL